MIAKSNGYFEEEGVAVELKEFTAGKFALQAFLSGSIDFAVSGEVPAALAALQGHDLRVITQVVKRTTNEVRIVAIKDGTVTSASDYFNLKKRRLSTSFGGGPEMFTYTFLKHIGVEKDGVEIISQRPEDMPAALQSRSVDAIAIFDPYAYIAEKQLGDQAITFKEPTIYSELYVLNARAEQLVARPHVALAILRALKRAEVFAKGNPKEARRIVCEYTKLDSSIVKGIWDNFDFRSALTPELLKYWHAEADWARDTGKVDAATPNPNFRSLIDESILRKVDPAAVEIQEISPGIRKAA